MKTVKDGTNRSIFVRSNLPNLFKKTQKKAPPDDL